MSPRGRKTYIRYQSDKAELPPDFSEVEEVQLASGSNHNPERVDRYLARQIKWVSRTFIQHIISQGMVWIDEEQVIRSSQKVLPGQQVLVRVPRKPRPVIHAEEIPLDVLYEDEHLMVINKSAGMVVHPARGNFSGTLVNALMGYLDDLPEEAGDDFRPGIVHRLDKDTTGLMVVARTPEIAAALSGMFFRREVQRIYRALVWTSPKRLQGSIEGDIGRDPRDRLKMTVVHNGRGRRAVTHYKTVARFDFLSLMELKLETGRTHQIRVHLQHLGHPVFGDEAYSGRDPKRGGFTGDRVSRATAYLQVIQRQALHSWRMGFEHPITGERLEFLAPMPADMQEVLNREEELGGRLPEAANSSVWEWSKT